MNISFSGSSRLTGSDPRIQDLLQAVKTKTGVGSDFLGRVDFADRFPEEEFERVIEVAQRLRGMSEVVVVIGIGGSYLGSKALLDTITNPFLVGDLTGANPRIVYAGHQMDEQYHQELLHYLDGVDYSVIVISKSGTTHEPKAAFEMIQAHCQKKYGNVSDRIVAITDANKGLLLQTAKDKGYTTFVVPDDVGGRYSVFTPVGLLPLAVGGYDIRALWAGVRSAMKEVYTPDGDAVQYALQRFDAYNNGKSVECFVTYEPRMAGLWGWWQQLFGESDGKDGKGLFPVCLQYSTDLHSMGQYMQEGPRNMIETMVTVQQPTNSLLAKSQEACIAGTTEAHEEGGVPVLHWELEDASAKTIGQFLYTMMVACALSGYLLGVNPFDQPGVEAYKAAMKKKMN